MLVNAEINDLFREREQAVRPPRPERNYWEYNNSYYNDPTTLEQRLSQIDLRREKAALRRELLGDTPPRDDDKNPIPVEKRELLRQINEDYNAMISQIQREGRGIPLPSDDEKLRYLRAEKEAELKALLSPEELIEHELRTSQTANSVRWNLAAFNPTEQEYRAVFSLQKEFDEQFPSQSGDRDSDYWKQRNEAQKALDARIEQQLGAERYRDYVRSKDHEYRNLATLAERLGLPQTAAAQAYDLRYTVSSDALKIVRDENLSPESKQEHINGLALKTRDDLARQLGAEAAEAYLKRHADWLKSMERGQIIEFKSDGGRQYHGVPKRASNQ